MVNQYFWNILVTSFLLHQQGIVNETLVVWYLSEQDSFSCGVLCPPPKHPTALFVIFLQEMMQSTQRLCFKTVYNVRNLTCTNKISLYYLSQYSSSALLSWDNNFLDELLCIPPAIGFVIHFWWTKHLSNFLTVCGMFFSMWTEHGVKKLVGKSVGQIIWKTG